MIDIEMLRQIGEMAQGRTAGVAVYPLSLVTPTDEVQAWFVAVMKRGSVPDETTCAVIASMLCNWQPAGWRYQLVITARERPEDRQAWHAAAQVLTKQIKQRRGEVSRLTDASATEMLASMQSVETALQEAEIWFGRPASRVVWHDIARTVLTTLQAVLGYVPSEQAVLKRVGVVSIDSPAVKVTKLALDRLGFPEATPAAIADLFRVRSP